MAAKKKPVAKPTQELPPDVKPADLKWPEMGHGLTYEARKELGLDSNALTFYQVKGARVTGWVLCTLGIGGKGKGSTARTYGIQVEDGKVCRVGRGPHVLQEVTVYLSADNLPRLRKYVDLLVQGLEAAGQIRDRISTRRAQGQLYRQQGRSSWMW